MGWLAHILGMDNLSGPIYGFWSGPGSVLLPGVPPAAVLYWKHNCHEPRCFRIGRFPIDGTVWHKCKKHHPDEDPGATAVASASVMDGETVA